MGFAIEDAGTGQSAHVDKEQHLHVASSTETLLAHRSHYDGTAYGASTPFLTVDATGGRMLFIQNTDPEKNLYITNVWVHSGEAVDTERLVGELIINDTAPITNTTSIEMSNMNRLYTKTGDATVLHWDGVGSGMTGHTAGQPLFAFVAAKGPNIYDAQGALILGQNTTVSFNLQAAGTGTAIQAAINILGFYK